jgi:hypothetical protein
MLYRFGAKIEAFGDSSIKTASPMKNGQKYFYGRFCALWAIGLF